MSAATFSAVDTQMMRRAIALAEQGRYSTPPNPRVGCVIAQDERVVGEGAHLQSGGLHAEALALAAAGAAARGATAYVTLEPHSHASRTPPCSQALIRAGVQRVVCGMLDPNPHVLGNGVRQMQDAGLQVEVGLLEAEVRELNLGFIKRMQSGLPRVRVKIAASLDGRVALANGESRWITGERARADVQRLRAESSAVLTGIGTALADDPQLNVRDTTLATRGRQPLRVVLDSTLRLPATARMLVLPGSTLIITTRSGAPADVLRRAGVEVLTASSSQGGIDLAAVLQELGRRECNDVLVEAGPTLAGRFIELGLCDELIVYFAPKLLGADARPLAVLPALTHLEQAPLFRLHDCVSLGDDVRLIYRPAGSL